jgi:hypothetical protein
MEDVSCFSSISPIDSVTAEPLYFKFFYVNTACFLQISHQTGIHGHMLAGIPKNSSGNQEQGDTDHESR